MGVGSFGCCGSLKKKKKGCLLLLDHARGSHNIRIMAFEARPYSNYRIKRSNRRAQHWLVVTYLRESISYVSASEITREQMNVFLRHLRFSRKKSYFFFFSGEMRIACALYVSRNVKSLRIKRVAGFWRNVRPTDHLSNDYQQNWRESNEEKQLRMTFILKENRGISMTLRIREWRFKRAHPRCIK